MRFTKKKVGILPLSLGLLVRSSQNFCRVTLSPFPIPVPSFIQIRPVFEEIYPKNGENVSHTHYNIGVKPVGFSPTTSKVPL